RRRDPRHQPFRERARHRLALAEEVGFHAAHLVFLRASARHSSRKYGRPRAAGTYPRRWNTLIRRSTISVNRYGSIRNRIEEVSIPRSCTRKPRASTAPNRYAPASSRSGFHVAKMTSAIAESTRSHREEKM